MPISLTSFSPIPPPSWPPLFPYTTLFRSQRTITSMPNVTVTGYVDGSPSGGGTASAEMLITRTSLPRSEEHTSELQSLRHLVCRLLLEKKKVLDLDSVVTSISVGLGHSAS